MTDPSFPPVLAVGPGSPLRSVAAEPVMFLGGQRALLLQLAHPLVAAGVEHHSGFRARPVRRLWSTIDALMCLVWGRPAEARAARDRILGIHDGVHGGVSPAEATSHVPVGTRYSAHDPELLWWVWATLVDTTEVVHDRFLGPLDRRTLDDLYADWCALARFMGIPAAMLDPDRVGFGARFARQRDHLELSATSRHVARSVIDPPVWFAPRALRRAYALVATSLLDDRTRVLYGLPWGPDEQAAAATIERQIRASWALVPGWRRELPDAYLRVRRVVVGTGELLAPHGPREATARPEPAILPR